MARRKPRTSVSAVYCSRYDFEGVESDKANEMMAHLREIIADNSKADFAPFKLATADDFEYTDPIDGPHAVPAALQIGCTVCCQLHNVPRCDKPLEHMTKSLWLTAPADVCLRERGQKARHPVRVCGRLAHHLPAVRDWLRRRHRAVRCAASLSVVV